MWLMLVGAGLGCGQKIVFEKDVWGANAIHVSCASEANSQEHQKTLIKNSYYQINLASQCSTTILSTQSLSYQAPLDIVFVLDITGSMDDNIETVRTQTLDFVETLANRGWDARFAAVGFRDAHESVPVTGFLKAPQFMNELSKPQSAGGVWFADGGDDDQEAGQLGLLTAAQLLKSKGRAGASKVLVMVTDVKFYSLNKNHDDFEIQTLVSALQKLSLNHLEFFCSAASDPSSQCTAIRLALQLGGQNLSFPFSSRVFNEEFVPLIREVVREERIACYPMETSLLNMISGRSVGQLSQPLSMLAKAGANQIKIEDEEFGDSHELTLRIKSTRCCTRDFRTCEKTIEGNVELRLVRQQDL